MTDRSNAAALIALLRARPGGMTWTEIAGEVAFRGEAISLLAEKAAEDALIADPALQSSLDEATAIYEQWASLGLRMVTVMDPEYPAQLRDIREAPPFLFAAGQLIDDDRGVSVVGSRQASEEGLAIAATAAGILIERGLTVIAGLAAGIDTAAHEAALRLGGRTVAVIGTGIQRYYPATNRELQDEIARRGLLLSQFWPDAPPTKQSFPMRNATMSGYGLATIVVEAGEHSGTRIQARLAIEHGRPVVLTDRVVTRTKWGAALVGHPGVYIANGRDELEGVIDRILSRQADLERALDLVAAAS